MGCRSATAGSPALPPPRGRGATLHGSGHPGVIGTECGLSLERSLPIQVQRQSKPQPGRARQQGWRPRGAHLGLARLPVGHRGRAGPGAPPQRPALPGLPPPSRPCRVWLPWHQAEEGWPLGGGCHPPTHAAPCSCRTCCHRPAGMAFWVKCPDLHGLGGRPKEAALPDACPVPGLRTPGARGSP